MLMSGSEGGHFLSSEETVHSLSTSSKEVHYFVSTIERRSKVYKSRAEGENYICVHGYAQSLPSYSW